MYVLSDSFNSVCSSYSSFTTFMRVTTKFMQVWPICIEILVILSPFFVYFIKFEPFKSLLQQFVLIPYEFHQLYVCKKQVQGPLF